MNKQEIIDRELEKLDFLTSTNKKVVLKALREIRNDSSLQLWLTPQDEMKLLTLKVWSIKYKCTIKFILLSILPIWNSFIKGRKIIKGLGVRVSTLISQKSEEFLKKAIQMEYPHGENKILWISDKQESIIQTELKRIHKAEEYKMTDPSRMGEDGRIKNLTDFSSPERFVRYYKRYMGKEHKSRERIIEQMKAKNYRNNPFHPESI